MYKGFALAVLLLAPILVMLADSIAPKHDAAPQAATAPAGAPSAPVSAQPRGAIPHQQTVAGQPMGEGSYTASAPMSDAGRPMLDPSQAINPTPTAGLPTAPVAFAPEAPAPAANPNAVAFAQMTAEWKSDRR